MKKYFSWCILVIAVPLFLLFSTMPLTAQENKNSIVGVYFLKGVMETACAFELKADSSFEFLFTQGALDRGGTGKWLLKDGRIVFNSTHARPAKDYALVNSKAVAGNATIVKMVDKNTMVLSYSDVTLVTAAGRLQQSTDSQGETRFARKHATEISLLFRICPDRPSVFTVNPQHNYFEFRLEPWIAEVFFDNFSLALANDELTGSNPLLEGTTFRYAKEQ